ncbi:MAG: hypothetical protein JWM21_4734 [Acidobacteria bacterium]|nr:hypothetical protein [Acidobacteriota bacterium]
MLRKVLLSILILLSVFAIMPFADSAARGLSRSIGLQRRHHRHHSRRWWRRHRAHMRHRQAAMSMAHRPATLTSRSVVTGPNNTPAAATVQPPAMSNGLSNGWSAMPAAANGEVKFRAKENATDQAALTVVALSRPAPAYLTSKEQRQMLSGISFAELRRSVIDKMITAGGWVNNDFEREVGGRRVFVVTAQTPAEGRSPEKAWNFYFTEVKGRIYSLATEANLQSAQRMAAEAERFIASLK